MIREVAHAFIYQGSRLLLQLRDNKPDIVYPNHWTLFGGSINSGETPARAIKRELEEELCWKPSSVEYVLTWEEIQESLIVHIFYTALTVSSRELKLTEGQKFGLFTFEELSTLLLVPQIRLWLPTAVEAIASNELSAGWQEFKTKKFNSRY